MKRTGALVLAILLCAALFAGCGGKGDDNIVFTGVIQEIHENAILVSTGDDVGFDLASVGISGASVDFTLIVGQTVVITIEPLIRESYPVQVTAVKIEKA